MRLIGAEDMSVKMGGKTVLAHVDFHIDAGEIVTIVGPNGSGKSTLGQVTRPPGVTLGYVPQKLQIDPTLPLTVRRFLNLPKRVAADAAGQALEQAGAAALADRQMADLSGGQFQRVLLARALLAKPRLLILDEPTQGLDQPGSAAFYRRIEEVRDELGCGVLMVSHELHVVMASSDRVICLNGHVCCEGAPEQVAQAEAYRALFGTGTGGALALYRHEHNHSHDHAHDHAQDDVQGAAE